MAGLSMRKVLEEDILDETDKLGDLEEWSFNDENLMIFGNEGQDTIIMRKHGKEGLAFDSNESHVDTKIKSKKYLKKRVRFKGDESDALEFGAAEVGKKPVKIEVEDDEKNGDDECDLNEELIKDISRLTARQKALIYGEKKLLYELGGSKGNSSVVVNENVSSNATPKFYKPRVIRVCPVDEVLAEIKNVVSQLISKPQGSKSLEKIKMLPRNNGADIDLFDAVLTRTISNNDGNFMIFSNQEYIRLFSKLSQNESNTTIHTDEVCTVSLNYSLQAYYGV